MSLVEDISRSLKMSQLDILKIISSAPRRYKIYGVPKRDGVGVRTIAQPAREVKAIQRYVGQTYSISCQFMAQLWLT
jgi:RNA-directed DNA polymerase